MGRKKKLIQFEQNKTFNHVVEPKWETVMKDEFEWQGKWNEFFGNDNPIVIELGCGKGEYTVGLAKQYPNKNFIGIDVKGNRLWSGAKTVEEDGMKNAAFLRSRIDYIEKFFAADEVSEIWLTFSDPHPKRPRRRLTSSKFIGQYRQFLKPDATIHMKTDNRLLFNFTLEQIHTHDYKCGPYSFDVYRELEKFPKDIQKALEIKTYYETLFSNKGFRINYLNFQLNG